MRILVLGAGAMGTSLAGVFSKQHRVSLYGRNSRTQEELSTLRENRKYLPKYTIPDSIEMISQINRSDWDMVVLAIPTQYIRFSLKNFHPHLKNLPLINTAKGLEEGTFLTPCQVLKDLGYPDENLYSLSGPSHAEEVALGIPTSVVLAGTDSSLRNTIQESLSSSTFRLYYNTDRLGVELGGALKNIIAIASGIATGLGFGINTISTIITRGLAEIRKYGEHRGARSDTFYGLSCLGDLVATCCSPYSRNRAFGEACVKDPGGEHFEQLAEGAFTLTSLIEELENLSFDMPLCQAVHRVISGREDSKKVMKDLLNRPLKDED